MKALELRLQIRNTAAFIEDNPSDVTFVRGVKTRTASGGSKRTTAPLPTSQRVRIIDQSSSTSPALMGQDGPDGTESGQSQMLVGLPTLDVVKEDRFTLGGFLYRVTELYPDNGYERRAYLERHEAREV